MKKRFSYVYILQSEVDPERFYVGFARDLRDRLKRHNAGQSCTLANGYRGESRPVSRSDKDRARNFEKYLKSSSGRAFLKKRL
jgi:predicted GIY-YIG superfamily endonuclease